ncbi:succinyldiaminopimelate transaminase [Nakamurella flavida]|uniref:Aminotransferase n=1 Tax=Nakamurella flavida TaxID=363630 RepID=A0A938YP62_9ACTN|nr:succinyldiaminopimelate transaminase [Nakamurella flavida]MBM9476952.1 succinyldiaminopimelate transaminase [Nakamurella flavida]MDP9779897.1 succinyldiaminopimelate transaminase [Nakamurella flavida]
MTRPTRGPAALPDFPWDALAPARELAGRHPDGLVDLSIGTPVNRVPLPVRTALGNASDAPGYPTVHGTAALREAYVGWLSRAHGVRGLDPEDVLPTIGSKELVASLPTQLGLGRGDLVVIPDLAYPTYEVGALMAGCTVLRKDGVASSGADRIALVWVNSPSNPTGRVLTAEQLARIVGWARQRGAVVASDECYIDLGWEASPVSVLDPEVCGKDHRGLLAVHSLSKRSNMAGYRAGFVSGDPELVGRLTALRRHLGAMVPAPIQAAAAAALDDDGHVLSQRSRYEGRRELLMDALDTAGFRIGEDGTSAAGLYLWCTRDEPAMESVEWLAERGILVAPGDIYGAAGARHIRVALTASDARVAAAVQRLG